MDKRSPNCGTGASPSLGAMCRLTYVSDNGTIAPGGSTILALTVPGTEANEHTHSLYLKWYDLHSRLILAERGAEMVWFISLGFMKRLKFS